MCQKHSKYNTKGQSLGLHCNGCHGRDPAFLVHFIFHEVLGQGIRLTFTSTSHLYFKVYHQPCDYQEHFSLVLFKVPFAWTCMPGEDWCSPVNKALRMRFGAPRGARWFIQHTPRSPERSLETTWFAYLLPTSTPDRRPRGQAPR